MFSQQNVPTNAVTQANVNFMSRVYMWMAFGVLVTALSALMVTQSPTFMQALFSNNVLLIGLFILQIGVVIAFTALINRMTVMQASLVYLGYAALLGVTFSVIFLIYTMQSISTTFFLSAFSFAGLSIFGYVTKRDLGPVGSFCTIGLFGLIGVMVLALFIPSLMSESVQFATAVIGIMIFAGLTAYDTQRIKSFNGTYGERGAIFGALILYLDFINLFLSMLRLFGDRR